MRCVGRDESHNWDVYKLQPRERSFGWQTKTKEDFWKGVATTTMPVLGIGIGIVLGTK